MRYLKDYSEIQKYLPGYTQSDLDQLIFKRQGKGIDSFMEVFGLHQVVKTNTAYRLTKEGLIASTELGDAKIAPEDFVQNIKKPNSTILNAQWLNCVESNVQKEEKISNILGGYGRFIMKTDARKLTLPLEIATSEKLAYYGAVAIPMGEKVIFPPEESQYPIWAMSLGKDYTKGYIMSAKAGGWYLEWHQDRPHFHMPLSQDAGGFYILGKAINHTTFELTAFKICFGTAVFTKRGTIHADSGLTGDRWAVGYATSTHFSTVLLRNTQNEYVDIEAILPTNF